MSSEKTTAIILRVVDFSETSCVLTLFSRDFGKLRGMAKGARRPKGPFESAIDLLALCRIVFLRKSTDALDLLTEAKLVRRFRVAGRDLGRLLAAMYVAELLNELTDDYDPHPELFDLADQTLEAMSGRVEESYPMAIDSAGPAEGEWIARHVLRFELVALRHLGHLPSLDACAQCGKAVAATTRVAFGHLAGGVLCGQCRPGQRKVVSITSQAMDALRRLADPEEADWRRMELPAKARGELRGVLNHYVAHLVGKPLRMHKWLKG
jgi:DNA repair protein RecO (recombination protein O)